MNKTPSLQIMTLKEVAQTMRISEVAFRTRIFRRAAGRSAPSFPAPVGKIAGAWFWDRRTVAKFLAKEKAGQERAMSIS